MTNFFTNIVLILILGGFLIFKYTDLSIFITYEIDGDGVDGYDLDNTLWRIFGGFGPFVALAGKKRFIWLLGVFFIIFMLRDNNWRIFIICPRRWMLISPTSKEWNRLFILEYEARIERVWWEWLLDWELGYGLLTGDFNKWVVRKYNYRLV